MNIDGMNRFTYMTLMKALFIAVAHGKKAQFIQNINIQYPQQARKVKCKLDMDTHECLERDVSWKWICIFVMQGGVKRSKLVPIFVEFSADMHLTSITSHPRHELTLTNIQSCYHYMPSPQPQWLFWLITSHLLENHSTVIKNNIQVNLTIHV